MGSQVKEALASWESLNTYLRSADEYAALKVLKTEQAGARRLNFLLRAHATYNKLRARRERDELHV
jgi:hypothetical protein